jgi:hypothetical protein
MNPACIDRQDKLRLLVTGTYGVQDLAQVGRKARHALQTRFAIERRLDLLLRHGAADEHLIDARQQRLDEADLVRHLAAAEDANERPFWVPQEAVEDLQLAGDEAADDAACPSWRPAPRPSRRPCGGRC